MAKWDYKVVRDIKSCHTERVNSSKNWKLLEVQKTPKSDIFILNENMTPQKFNWQFVDSHNTRFRTVKKKQRTLRFGIQF